MPAAFPSPYTDLDITTRGPYSQSITNALPSAADANLGPTPVYEVAGTDHEPDNSAVEPPAHAGSKWVLGRNPYANDGAVGQEFLDNQGS